MMKKEIITTTENTFDIDVLGEDKPVVAAFVSSMCEMCPLLNRQREELAEQKVPFDIVIVDGWQVPQPFPKYGIEEHPTLILFRKGKEINRLTNPLKAQEIKEWDICALG